MSEQNFGGNGFEVEGDVPAEPLSSSPKTTSVKRPSDQIRHNIKAVFGHGVGKISVVVAGFVIFTGVAFAFRGVNKNDESLAAASVQVPEAPQPVIDNKPISQAEATRRAQAAAEEAKLAAAKQETYQPAFATNIQPAVNTGPGAPPPLPNGPQAAPITVAVPTDVSVQQRGWNEPSAAPVEYEQRLAAAESERSKWVDAIRNETLNQAKQIKDQNDGRQQSAGYTTTTYARPATPSAPWKTEPQRIVQAPSSPVDNLPPPSSTDQTDATASPTVANSGKLLIKTGKILYATLDAAVNTDDGGAVLATLRGGEFDGARLIGRVEQAPNNIRINFTILAPQDDRPTLKINAVALREQDASQGVAQKIDSHTLERYTALASASLLSGYGRAFANPVGTTVFSPAGVASTTISKPTDEQIAAVTVGEVGQSFSSEVRRGFNRPTTYSTPAGQGFGLFFLEDLYAP